MLQVYFFFLFLPSDLDLFPPQILFLSILNKWAEGVAVKAPSEPNGDAGVSVTRGKAVTEILDELGIGSDQWRKVQVRNWNLLISMSYI